MEIIRRSGLILKNPKSETNLRIIDFLTRVNKDYQSGTISVNKFYVEKNGYLLIPRYFPIEEYYPDHRILDQSSKGEKIEIEHNITPRSEIQKKMMQYLVTNRCGIIKLDPGMGKTVISIYAIATRKVKTFILVHRKSLVDQWKERLKTFTNISQDRLSILSSNSFEDDLEKDIIISTTQSFLSLLKRKEDKFLPKLKHSKIGLFIADEVHTSVGAPTFSKCSIFIPSYYTFGLSATPTRHDGNHDIIQFHLGDIVTDLDGDKTGVVPARVSVLLLDFQIDIPKRYKYLRWGGQFQRSRYLTQMRKSKPFLSCLKGVLLSLKNRNVICMVERTKLIEDLFKWFPHDKAAFCGQAGLESLKPKMTFATPGKGRDGIDAPWKDVLVLTSPISNINQVTGRVVRKTKGKSMASVIDFVDYGCKEIAQTFFRRRTFYQEKGWEICYYMVKDGKVRSLEEDIALDIISGRN